MKDLIMTRTAKGRAVWLDTKRAIRQGTDVAAGFRQHL
jgi:uncharacterized NAD-dependent epimerase/dehydratase family protein